MDVSRGMIGLTDIKIGENNFTDPVNGLCWVVCVMVSYRCLEGWFISGLEIASLGSKTSAYTRHESIGTYDSPQRSGLHA